MGQKGPKKGPKTVLPFKLPIFPFTAPIKWGPGGSAPVHTPNYPVHSPNYRGPGVQNPAYIIYIGKTILKIVQSLQSLNFFDTKKCPFSRSLAQLLDEKKGHFLCTFWALFDDFLTLFEKWAQKSRFFGQKSDKNRPIFELFGRSNVRRKKWPFFGLFRTFFPARHYNSYFLHIFSHFSRP